MSKNGHDPKSGFSVGPKFMHSVSRIIAGVPAETLLRLTDKKSGITNDANEIRRKPGVPLLPSNPGKYGGGKHRYAMLRRLCIYDRLPLV